MRRATKWLIVAVALLGGVAPANADGFTECRRGQTPETRIKACTDVLARENVSLKNMTRAYQYRAAAYALVRKHKKAVEDYTFAIRTDPNYGLAYAGRGHARLALRDVEGAVEDYTAAIAKLPRYAPVYVARGYAFFTQDRFDAAIKDFKTAIRISPQSPTAHNNLALAQRKKGLPSLAIESLDEAIRINPAYALAYNNRAYTYEAMGLIENAISDFRTAIFLDPSLAGARLGLKRHGIADGFAKDSGELIRSGRKLAEKNCAFCHAVGRRGVSKHKTAPPFRVVQNRHPVLALRKPLERAIAYPHDEMPKFKLSDAQIDTIVAYINSLQVRRK